MLKTFHTGIVHEYVDAAVRLDRLLRQLGKILRVRYVADNRDRYPSCVLNLLLQLLKPVAGSCRQDDTESVVCQVKSNGSADASGCARDNSNLFPGSHGVLILMEIPAFDRWFDC